MTASHSASVMLKIIRSRRMPATLTRMSMRPKVPTACSTIAAAWSKSATEPELVTACRRWSDLVHDLVGRGGLLALALEAGAEIVDHDPAPAWASASAIRVRSPPGAGDQSRLAVQHAHGHPANGV